MEMQPNHHNLFERRSITKSKAPTIKWFKEWVPQDVVTTGGKCMILKWVNEATLKAMKEKLEEPGETVEPDPEPTTEVLFLCSFEGCGKTFIDAGALRKHSHIHGERQYVCHYEGCGKKFLDSSKLKRHFLIHTGERDFICPHEGCGKAFSLDFNLRSHMKTHSQENYHICPYNDCGKRYAHEYKLKNHISSQHEKNMVDMIMPMPMPMPMPVPVPVHVSKYPQPPEKPAKTPKASSTHAPVSLDRPHGCPYDGCEKAYIHEYKLKLHLKREHLGHFSDENARNNMVVEHEMNEGSDQEVYHAKHASSKVIQKRSKPRPNLKQPPLKVSRKGTSTPANNVNVLRKPWPVTKDEAYEEEDSEETEEDMDNNVEGSGWRYGENNEEEEEDDEETEDED